LATPADGISDTAGSSRGGRMQLHHEARRLKLAIEAAWLDPHGQEIKLPCNFGRHKAMLIGPSEAKGDLGFPLDGDLEVEPEWLAPRD
jgi:hypothetical protein